MADCNVNADLLKQISPKLTEETLQTCLRTYSGRNDVKMTHYEIGGGSAKGDSYLSIVSRISVQGESVSDNKKYTSALIVKSLPPNLGRRKTFRSCEFFRNEVNFYNEVLPRLMAFQEKKKPKNPFNEIPRCFEAVADGENDFVLMEDVSCLGYKPPKRQEGFDFEHCCTVLQILGRFHALSLAMKDQDPEEFKKAAGSIKETFYSPENRQWYAEFLEKLTDVAYDAVSKELPGTLYEEKLKKFVDKGFYDRMIEMAKPVEPYAVIGQGDAWSTNFLFCYNDENDAVAKGIMIDFQLARYGSPILDLSFMICSCTNRKLRDSHYDDLLQFYYKSLCELVKDLGSSPEIVFPYKDFQKEISAYSSFGFGMAVEAIPFCVIDSNEAPDLELMTGDEEVSIGAIMCPKPIKSKEGRLRFTDVLCHIVDRGYW